MTDRQLRHGGVQVVQLQAGQWAGRFTAMASPCEVLARGADRATMQQLAAMAAAEAKRIEHKYSRYRDDSVIARINAAGTTGAAAAPVPLDEETQRLLAYADELHRLSGGLFDITSGVLRRAWTFDGSDRVPAAAQVEALLPLIGWSRVDWQGGDIRLPPGMQLDFGGIGKEYAVDRTLALLQAEFDGALLVNFGGDIAAGGRAPPEWRIGIENPAGGEQAVVHLRAGGIATSGDARRFLLKDGVRYGHILDPRNGWPVAGAPRSVTVVARSCVEAGTLSTLAMLQGAGAGEFLAAQDRQHWIQW